MHKLGLEASKKALFMMLVVFVSASLLSCCGCFEKLITIENHKHYYECDHEMPLDVNTSGVQDDSEFDDWLKG